MRWTLGFILPVLVAAGCVSTGPLSPVEDAGPPTGDAGRTQDYWNVLRGVMSQKTSANDLRSLASLVQKQSETIRGLSPEGVDPELAAAAEAVAKAQERVIQMAEIADFELAALRASPAVAKQFAQANQEASAAQARLAHLHARLSSRYDMTFTPFGK